ncbi:hypothetical protein BGW42_008673 [Actinomortierella wolfii]|nr:hypothetical protein BGW42_008673 [Actinomortierella wolfii]
MEVDDEEDEEDDGEIIPSTKVSKDMKDTTKGKQGSPSAAENKSQRSGSISEDGQEIHKCANCGKVYKHPNCLAKHRWEHSKYWKSATKFYLSKHQQVRMMEAAAILLGLDSMRNRDDDEIVNAIIHGRVQSTNSVRNSSRSPPPRSLSRTGYHDDAMVMDKGIRLGERKASSTKTELMSESETTVVPKKEEQPSVAVGTDTQSAAAPLSISPQSQSDVSMSGSPPSLVPDDRSSTTSSMSSNSSHDIDTPMLEVKRAGTNGAIDGKTYSSSESALEAPLIGESGHYQHRHLPSREPYAYGRVPPINSQHDPRYANPPQEDYSTLPQHSSPADVAVARKPMVSSAAVLRDFV